MKSALYITAILLAGIVSVRSAKGFIDILLDEVTEAAKYYFSKNANLDDTGFNVIDEDEYWSATDLFKEQYGESASTARFVAAILDFQYFEQKIVSFSDVTQLIIVGEHQDARKGFGAYTFDLVFPLIDANHTIGDEDVDEAKTTIRQAFRSTYSIVGDENFASFLNLKLGSSLSFVMDTTGSMSGEINAAKSRVVNIIQETNGTNSAPLNYVLVPYNDPGYGPVTKTSDPDVFVAAVNSLRATGGGDIPELAMIGILEATQNSGFRSIVYVFTDAEEKDTDLQNQVIALCLEKKVSVYIFLTKSISKRKKRALLTGRALYDNIAEQTGGLVILVEKTDIEAATEIMKATTVQGLVMLSSVGRTNATSVVVNVDSSVSSLTVQFTGVFSYQGITTDSDGFHNVTELTSITGVKLFRLDGVTPGMYTFTFDPAETNEYGALIRGNSGLGFHAHLSQKKRGTDTYVASRQLLAGAETIAAMTVYGEAENVEFETFQLVSGEGQVLMERALSRGSESEYHVEGTFILPEEPMLVKLIGSYEERPLERIDPCAITPTVAESYLEDIEDVTILAGETVQVTTVIHNEGGADRFVIQVSDNRNFVSLDGDVVLNFQGLQFDLDASAQRILTLTITVSAGTPLGVLSKVLLTATEVGDNYFVFTTFVVSVVDGVTRCPSPTNPIGGSLDCAPDSRSAGSRCDLQCGDEYVMEGNGFMFCQADGTWGPASPGNCRLLGSKTCSLGGDPHYTTFDALRYDFMGSCMYTLVETHQGSGVEEIKIQTKNALLYGRTRPSWFDQGFVTIHNTTVHFKFGKVVLIDGIRISLPAVLEGGRLQIKLDGGDVLLTTDFKLEVRYNGAHYFRVSLPASYIGKVSGLCGNYDGDVTNEMMVGNSTFTSASDFGNALEIIGGSEPWCRKGQVGDDEDGCANAAQRAIYAEKCAALKSDCFDGCAENHTVDDAFAACVYDICQYEGNEEVVEDALADFAKMCAQRGIQVCNWRHRFEYPKTCPKNSHYEFLANRCPNTCVDARASRRCITKTRTEDCVCNTGFVRDGTDCVRQSECGCAYQGRYYKKGVNFLRENCRERCECTDGVLECLPMSCDEGTECRILPNGVYGCQAQQVDHCYATGDPHYKTLDGSTYNFMGICRYVMVSTKNATLSDDSRHVTISAQNEHRGANTRVSYVRAIYLDIAGYEIKLGPGTAVTMERNGSTVDITNGFEHEDELFSASTVGRFARITTKFGVSVKFDGTNLYIDVPSLYMHKVSGLCGNYTGMKEDDFGGKTFANFVSDHIYMDGCGEGLIEPFVCSDEDKATWGEAEHCGKMKDPNGPFQYCHGTVNVEVPFENCVFDACANEAEDRQDAIDKAIQAYAEACLDQEQDLPCNWETVIGITHNCPENSEYDGCASTCTNTCQDPEAKDRCQSTETTGKCVCMLGYIMNDGVCVKKSTCGCVLEDGEYVQQGSTRMMHECEYFSTCVGPGSVAVEEDPCGEDAKCKQAESGEFQCIPDELAYALVYGGVHHKTFDDKFFDFQGNCGYLLAGYAYQPDSPLIPAYSINIINKKIGLGMVRTQEVMVEIWTSVTEKQIIKVSREKAVTIDGVRFSLGSNVEQLKITQMKGSIVLNFAFGVQVYFNGDDWVRVDVAPHFAGKLHGMAGDYNGNHDDDFLIGDIMHTAEQWGDFWYRERHSSMECSRTTPVIDIPCLFRERFHRSCDCGVLNDASGPFALCHERMDPEPFTRSCVYDACVHMGSPLAIAKVLKTYYLACLGKGILVEDWRDYVGFEMECPMHSHYEERTDQCQPTCGETDSGCPSIISEGCVCDEGYILSNGKCVPNDQCGCSAPDGSYYEHGYCFTNAECSLKCTCVYGELLCEDHSCLENQECGILDGVLGCHWKDMCKYDNGGCNDICNYDEVQNTTCSCRPGRILTKDNHTCVDISPMFFSVDAESCDTTFNIWKAEFMSWQNNYLPEWMKELEDYREYVRTGIISADLDVCRYSWTEWYDRDDPEGCGDEETLELLRAEHPEICKKPIAAEGRMADGGKIGSVVANFDVDATGLVCKNAEQERGTRCPNFAVRFLCRINGETETPRCG